MFDNFESACAPFEVEIPVDQFSSSLIHGSEEA